MNQNETNLRTQHIWLGALGLYAVVESQLIMNLIRLGSELELTVASLGRDAIGMAAVAVLLPLLGAVGGRLKAWWLVGVVGLGGAVVAWLGVESLAYSDRAMDFPLEVIVASGVGLYMRFSPADERSIFLRGFLEGLMALWGAAVGAVWLPVAWAIGSGTLALPLVNVEPTRLASTAGWVAVIALWLAWRSRPVTSFGSWSSGGMALATWLVAVTVVGFQLGLGLGFGLPWLHFAPALFWLGVALLRIPPVRDGEHPSVANE